MSIDCSDIRILAEDMLRGAGFDTSKMLEPEDVINALQECTLLKGNPTITLFCDDGAIQGYDSNINIKVIVQDFNIEGYDDSVEMKDGVDGQYREWEL